MTTLANREATPAQAKARSAAIKRMVREADRSWIAIAQRLIEGRHALDYRALGFANVKDWLAEQLDGAMSVPDAFKKMRILEKLPFLSDSKILEIPSRNADQLTRLPEKERKKPEWVAKAKAASVDAFREEVQAFVEKRTGMKRDVYVTFSRRVTEAAFNHFELAIAEFARAEGIDLEHQPEKISEVLDLMAAMILLELQSRAKEEVPA